MFILILVVKRDKCAITSNKIINFNIIHQFSAYIYSYELFALAQTLFYVAGNTSR